MKWPSVGVPELVILVENNGKMSLRIRRHIQEYVNGEFGRFLFQPNQTVYTMPIYLIFLRSNIQAVNVTNILTG